ncbi:MAG: alpha/beta hydrolase [Rhizomicrobium sp.]
MGAAEIDTFKRAWRERAANGRENPPTLEQQRRLFDDEHGAIPLPVDCNVDVVEFDGGHAERLTPHNANKEHLLIYHYGGGHIFGSLRIHRHFVARLAEASRSIALNMHYRLAPECPYPCGLEDAVRDYRPALHEGFAPSRVVVAGESAGGNLTAALLLKLRELALPLPAGAYLLSPWLDMILSGDSYGARATHDPMLTREALEQCALAYCGGGGSPGDPYISPLNASLHGLPPIYLHTGTDEILLSDAVGFARKAGLVGGSVYLSVWRDMVHAWPLFHSDLSSAAVAPFLKLDSGLPGSINPAA